MEDTLGVKLLILKELLLCLNPYSNGRYSRRTGSDLDIDAEISVLILILMEDTLGVYERMEKT